MTHKKPGAFILFVCLPLLAGGSPAMAVFPDKLIAHGDPSMTKEAADPEYEKVHALLRDRKFAAALPILEEKIKKEPNSATPLILKALILKENGNAPDALRFIQAGFEREPHHPAIHFAFCQTHRAAGQGEQSDRACRIALQQHPDNPDLLFEFAQTLMARGAMADAVFELAKASEKAPANPVYHYERGLALLYLNKTNEAEKAFREALAKDPENLDAAYQLGYIAAVGKKPEQAKKYLDRLVKAKTPHPKTEPARLVLDYINKNETAKLPARIVPHEYHAGRAQALYKSGQYGLALLEMQTAAKLQPDDPKMQEILVGLNSLLMRADATEAAVNNLLRLTKDDKAQQARCHQELGDVAVARGQLEQAQAQYKMAVSLGDPNGLAKSTLDEFPKELPKSGPLPFDPNELFVTPEEGLNRKGEVFAHFGMNKRAISLYSQALKLNPAHLMGQLNMAMAHYRSGELNRAISLLEKALVSHPLHEHIGEHRLLLAEVYVKKGDTKAVLRNLEQLIKLNPGYKKVVRSSPAFESLREDEGFKTLLQ